MIFRLLLMLAIVWLVFRYAKRLVRWLEQAPREVRAADAPAGAAPSTERRSPHDVLGVPLGATQDEVRAAYQKIIQQYHPDRVASMGPEFRELAEQKTKEINAAYDALKRG